jgi:hypothetical protein
MACAQLGELSAANHELAASRGPIEDEAIRAVSLSPKWKGYWFDWAIARILLRETIGLIEEKQDAAR